MTKQPSQFQTVIEANAAHKNTFKELVNYRELFYFLAWRDILVRYKQTVLGVCWAIIRPLLTMAVFSLVFGKIAHLANGEVNYSLFVLAGLLPWLLFSGSLIDTSQSLANNRQMISKIYFPRVILPISDIAVHLVDFAISLFLFLLLIGWNGYLFHWSIVFIPLFIVHTLILSIGCGLWLSALSARYRDFSFIVPFLVQFGVFLSPVGYSAFLLSEEMQWMYFINPMAGIIEGFRWCCFGILHPQLMYGILLSLITSTFLLISGFRFFRKFERTCVDII